MNWLDTLLSLPEVCEFLQSPDWAEDFRASYVERGRRLSDAGMVLEVDHFIGSKHNFVGKGKVQGSRSTPYKVSLIGRFDSFEEEWTFWGECSCPMQEDCKHVAAFVFDLQKAIGSSQGGGSSAHQQWLEGLQATLAESSPPPEKTPKKRRTNGLAFLLVPREDGKAEIRFGKLRYYVNGPDKVDSLHVQPNTDRVPPAYFWPGDYELVKSLLEQTPAVPGARSYWVTERVLHGPIAGILLPQLIETGRLFDFESFAAAQRDVAPPPLSLGDLIEIGPRWETDMEGRSRPVVGLPASDSDLLELDRLYYLDREKMLLGPVEVPGGESPDFLRLWAQGPKLDEEHASELTMGMEERGLAKVVPRPAKLEEKIHPATAPVITLTLRREPFLSYLPQAAYGGMVRVTPPASVLAELTFDYDGVEVGLPIKKASRIRKHDHILIVDRDLEVEELALETVKAMGLEPLEEYVDPQMLRESCQFSLGPDEELDDWDFYWANQLATTLPELTKRSWAIRYDPSFDLTVTQASELVTDLTEDPVNGIDWFHFEVGLVTDEGKRQSLMELIANYLRSDEQIPEEKDLEQDQRVLVSAESGISFFDLPARRFFRIVRSVRDLFSRPDDGLHRLEAAKIAEELALDDSQTLADLAALGEQLRKKEPHQPVPIPSLIKADLRDYQKDGFQWLQFLARHHLHGILADDMGLGKTIQTLAHIAAEIENDRHAGDPSLVVAPTSVVPNWEAEAKKFAPSLKVLVLHGTARKGNFINIDKADIVITSYALLQRDEHIHKKQTYHLAVLDEAQYIKNPKAKVAIAACRLDARHRLCLSGTPMENHLGELWSLSRFLMPGLLGSQVDFSSNFRTPIERHQDGDAQRLLNNKVGSLILRRTKDEVVKELPPKTEIIHRIPLNKPQQDLYESVRVALDEKVREAIADKGLARSQIIVLDALLKLRQICCHPKLIKTEIAKKAKDSAKLDFLVDLLATLVEEGRRILLFSQFTTMLGLIEDHLKKEKIPYVKITGATRNRKTPVETFQEGKTPVFLISLKAGGTGLNLTAADTVIHYDPWWNPAAENQATDRAHRIGQKNPVFVHKLISEGTIEERILELQARKSKLVEALLSEKTNKLQLDPETLNNLFAPVGD